MTRSRALAIARADATGPVVFIRPADIGTLLEAVRYHGETQSESGLSTAAHRRLIAAICTADHEDPDRWTID